MRRERFTDFVEHPRYGRFPIESDEGVPVEHYSQHWRYHDERYLPETAIRADIARQNYTVSPLIAYADLKKQCRTCGRNFLFFAREQKHWYEDLRFPQDADCIHCPTCRKENQRTQQLRKRQQELLSRQEELADHDWLVLATVYAELFRRGIVKDGDKIRWALNRITSPEKFADEINQLWASLL